MKFKGFFYFFFRVRDGVWGLKVGTGHLFISVVGALGGGAGATNPRSRGGVPLYSGCLYSGCLYSGCLYSGCLYSGCLYSVRIHHVTTTARRLS
jgi:hypothetical protein